MSRIKLGLGVLVVVGIVASACQPQVITKEVVKEVEVTKEVIKNVEVIKEVMVEPAAAPMAFAGVNINVLTVTGPQIAEPMQRRGAEFSAATGATVNVTVVPFGDLYQKALTDFASGTNSADIIVFDPQWMGDYVQGGFLEDLSGRVGGDPVLKWEDIGPFFRDFSATYKGKVYTIPLDGDFHMVYYRSDFVSNAPQTWADYISIAKQFQGKDLNGDGEADYGSCIAKKRSAQSYWMVMSMASAWLQSNGTAQGGFFDLDTFEPLYGPNPGFSAALDVYSETTKYGPPDELNLDVGDTRGLFSSGRCALSIDWGDIGTLAIDPKTSKVMDKVGAVILPGSREVLDRATGKLVACDAKTCPYAIDGINHAPFAAFGGWSGAINAASKPEVKDAAFAYLAYVSGPAQSNNDVTVGATGFNPFRLSQFLNRTQWVSAGMSAAAASNYLGAIESSLNSPNMVLDLRIPQNAYYQGQVMDTAVAQFLAGELTKEEAMAQIRDGWNAKSDELGRDIQFAAYKDTLGVKK